MVALEVHEVDSPSAHNSLLQATWHRKDLIANPLRVCGRLPLLNRIDRCVPEELEVQNRANHLNQRKGSEHVGVMEECVAVLVSHWKRAAFFERLPISRPLVCSPMSTALGCAVATSCAAAHAVLFDCPSQSGYDRPIERSSIHPK